MTTETTTKSKSAKPRRLPKAATKAKAESPKQWRVAESLLVLRNQINTISPNRQKISDGTIGDPSHASRNSDHNPWVVHKKVGVVTALDITHDPVHGIDSRKLADALLASKDNRIKYVISNGQIASGFTGQSPWVWRKYEGKNPHRHHMHLSVMPGSSLFDNDTPWRIETFTDAVPPILEEARPTEPAMPVLAMGTKGHDVEKLQYLLNTYGFKLTVDSDFGPKTKRAVMEFQAENGAVVDGIVGPHTWALLQGQ